MNWIFSLILSDSISILSYGILLKVNAKIPAKILPIVEMNDQTANNFERESEDTISVK